MHSYIRRRIILSVVVTACLAVSPALADSSPPASPAPADLAQSSDPSYAFGYTQLSVGSTTHVARIIRHTHDTQVYMNEGDVQFLVDQYPLSWSVVGLVGDSMPAYEYRITDPYITLKSSLHPFQPKGPLPDYVHLTKVTINGQFVGDVAVVSVGATYPNDDQTHSFQTMSEAAFDDIRLADLLPIFQMLHIPCTVTANGLSFPAIPGDITPPSAVGSEMMYVGDISQNVLPIALQSRRVFLPIQIASNKFNFLRTVVMTPNGKSGFIADNIGKGLLYPLNLATNQVGQPIQVGPSPNEVALTPDGKTVYVAGQHEDTVTAIDTATLNAEPPIQIGQPIEDLVISQDGKTAYVSTQDFSHNRSAIIPVDLATATVKSAWQYPSLGIASMVTVNSDVYALAYAQGQTTVECIDGKTGRIIWRSNIRPWVDTMQISPDKSTLYLYQNGSLFAFDVQQRKITWSIVLPKEILYEDFQISPDGKTIYVLSSAGTHQTSILSIDTRTHRVRPGDTITTGFDGFTLSIAPDQAPTAHFTYRIVTQNHVHFDASSSQSELPIAQYAWDFGDGTSVHTVQPTVQHRYAKPGTYTVTVTETDTAGATVDNAAVYDGHMDAVNAGAPSAKVSLTVTIPASTA